MMTSQARAAARTAGALLTVLLAATVAGPTAVLGFLAGAVLFVAVDVAGR